MHGQRRQVDAARRAILALVLIFFAQLTFGSTALSLTSDEPPHIAHGYLLLTTGDTWALTEHRHPPLLNMLSALPLLLQPEHPDVTTLPGWHEDFAVFVRSLWPLLGPVERQAFVTRVPTMLLAVMLMALVARWARQYFGSMGAVLAVAVMAFDPTMVAHSQLATTDAGVALLTCAAIYLAARSRPGLVAALGAGAAAGAAMAAKGSAVMVLPIVIALQGFHVLRTVWSQGIAERRHGLGRWVVIALATGLAAFGVLWAAYGFRLEPTQWEDFRLPLVAHAQMVRLILGEKARTAFLMGEIRQGGWWWYFPFAFLVKTPLPLIAMLIGTAVRLASRPRQLLGHPELWAYPLLHVGTAIASGMNIGFRHLLPVFPFGYVAIAGLLQARPRVRANGASGVLRGHLAHLFGPLLALAVGWLAMEAAMVFPFGLAYFNQLVGGPDDGYRVLVDSNVDWGQSFKALAAYMEDEAIDTVRLSYYTWIDPALYGVDYEPLPPAGSPNATLEHPYSPTPGVYAISATPLQGVMVADPDLYSWFRQREPDAQPGYGLLVYRVEAPPTQPTWVAQCTRPVVPLTAEAVALGFGRDDLRAVTFDCTQGWIIPTGGSESGWYAIHSATTADSFVLDMLGRSGAVTSYEQPRPGYLPPFRIYTQDRRGDPEGMTLIDPLRLGPLALIGYTGADRVEATAGETIHLQTWWRVEAPCARPSSLMLHAAIPGQPPIATGDGLGVPCEAWREGDWIIQDHILSIPPETMEGTYSIYTGGYWLDTMERWEVVGGEQPDTIPLSTLTVLSGE